MKNRNRQRENRKRKPREERIGKCNTYGVKDLTVFNAVEQIRTGNRSEIVLR